MQKVLQFINEVKSIMANISWPQKDTLIQLTIVVISISVAISTLLGGFDYLLTNSFALLANSQSKTNNLIVEPSGVPESTNSGTASPSAQPTQIVTPTINK